MLASFLLCACCIFLVYLQGRSESVESPDSCAWLEDFRPLNPCRSQCHILVSSPRNRFSIELVTRKISKHRHCSAWSGPIVAWLLLTVTTSLHILSMPLMELTRQLSASSRSPMQSRIVSTDSSLTPLLGKARCLTSCSMQLALEIISTKPVALGGKVDDTSVVVGEIIEWTEAHTQIWSEARQATPGCSAALGGILGEGFLAVQVRRNRRWKDVISCGGLQLYSQQLALLITAHHCSSLLPFYLHFLSLSLYRGAALQQDIHALARWECGTVGTCQSPTSLGVYASPKPNTILKRTQLPVSHDGAMEQGSFCGSQPHPSSLTS